jgi:hypothetical protein
MRLAAGIARVELSCHADTWEWLEGRLRSGYDWRPMEGGRVQPKPERMVTVDLSGPRVVAILERLRATDAWWHFSVDRSNAARLHQVFLEAIEGVDPEWPGEAPVRVVVDDRARGASEGSDIG